jgi:hypothetical protein
VPRPGGGSLADQRVNVGPVGDHSPPDLHSDEVVAAGLARPQPVDDTGVRRTMPMSRSRMRVDRLRARIRLVLLRGAPRQHEEWTTATLGEVV